MKKTLIAAGIAAVVAAPAFADVKISGVVEQNFEFADNAAMDGDSDNSLTFSASEDLGNGMTAFASITLDSDNTATSDTKDEKVGLKGSWGTFVTGRMEDFTRSKIHSKMTFVGAGGAAGEGLEGEINRGAGRTNDGFAYVSPTVNGFHVGIASYNDEATDVAAFYDNGPLSLAISYEQQKPSLTGTTTTEDQELLAMAASYTMGDLKATIVRSSLDNEGGTAANDSDDMAYRLDYKMGNNTISLGYLDQETTAGADDGDVTVVELHHAMSKRTGIAVSYMKDDNTGATADVDTLNVGLYHKF